jgi:hypothetical protein
MQCLPSHPGLPLRSARVTRCTAAAQNVPAGDCAITTTARRAATPAAPAPPTRRNSNPLGNVIDAIRGGGDSSNTPGGGTVTPAAQQTLRCTFATLSSKREIRYTAVGSVVGTWTNVATVQAPGETPKNDTVPVIVVSTNGC